MIFRGWQKTSLIEYPEKIATVVFTGGCNFRCPFCYNKDLVLSPRKLPEIREREVLNFLSENSALYEAVIVTGGEPTMHADLPGFFEKTKRLGILRGLETNGTNPDMLERMLDRGLVNYVAMDIKAPFVWEKYSRAAGISDRKLFDNVRKSAGIMMRKAGNYEFRTTVVPGIHTEDDILSIAEGIKGAKKYALQQFTPRETTLDPSFSGVKPLKDSMLQSAREKIKHNFQSCILRNV